MGCRSRSSSCPPTVTGILYALRTHHLAGTARAVPGWRRACFWVGWR